VSSFARPAPSRAVHRPARPLPLFHGRTALAPGPAAGSTMLLAGLAPRPVQQIVTRRPAGSSGRSSRSSRGGRQDPAAGPADRHAAAGRIQQPTQRASAPIPARPRCFHTLALVRMPHVERPRPQDSPRVSARSAEDDWPSAAPTITLDLVGPCPRQPLTARRQRAGETQAPGELRHGNTCRDRVHGRGLRLDGTTRAPLWPSPWATSRTRTAALASPPGPGVAARPPETARGTGLRPHDGADGQRCVGDAAVFANSLPPSAGPKNRTAACVRGRRREKDTHTACTDSRGPGGRGEPGTRLWHFRTTGEVSR
jgi:hypothetical protein